MWHTYGSYGCYKSDHNPVRTARNKKKQGQLWKPWPVYVVDLLISGDLQYLYVSLPEGMLIISN